ncbi:hypothetical protein JVX91_21905 [Pseudomonas sp. PDNC002]|uniref:hypothetical protein n=1 Tax=Pseudomonas sp. PDNC002 TaxID=2811422 RepID=UPI001964D4D0|nr:hypothetical protein [Pseudomonas sp. PDNC002]QRY78225.1 hypothetical protein JVX91_21905 [Pseudomonas sp. PDNC002]
MNLKTLVVSLAIGTSLAGCDQGASRTPGPTNWVSVPTLPIMQDAIITMAPTFNGQRDVLLSGQICALATGQATQDQVNDQLRKLNIEPTRLPLNSPDSVSLLVNGDRAGQIMSCAAFQATEVLRPVDPQEFMKAAVAVTDAQKPEDKPAHVAVSEQKPEFDGALLARVLPLRIAQARANADVFALIAEQLQRTPGLSVQEYRDKTRELFARLAPAYLERVRLQMPPSNASYQVVQLDKRHLVFGNNVGTRYDFSADNGLVLTQNGQIWYGKGHLLGSIYRLRAAYFPADVAKLLSARRN